MSTFEWTEEELTLVRQVGTTHRPAAIHHATDELECHCGHKSSEPDGLEKHRAELILDALAPFVTGLLVVSGRGNHG